ncbi:MAG: bactofilin family protein [Thermoleophilia bacterium]
MRAGVLLAVVAVLVLAIGAGTASAQTEYRMTGDLYLGPEKTVDSLVTLNGDITVEGHVLDTVFTANGDVHVLPSGRVDGDAVSITGQVIVDEGGVVSGDRVEMGGRAAQIGDARPVAVDRDTGFGGTGWFFWLLGGMGLGLLLVLLAVNSLKSVGHEVSTRTARSALVGFLAPLGLLVLFVVLLISVIGIPVALLLIPLVPLTAMFGLFAIAMLAGRRLLEVAGKGELGDVWAMLAGVVLLNLVSLIPVVGALTWIVGGFVGFGATVARIWDHYLGRRAVRAASRTNGVAAGPVPPVGPPTGPMAPLPTAPIEPVASEAPVLPEAPIVPAPPAAAAEPEARPRDPGPRFHI